MQRKKILVLGAGISGLAFAWFLRQQGIDDLAILEAAPQAGGWIRSEHQKGVLFECGPRGFRPKGKGKATLKLIEALGLQEQVTEGSPLMKKRYLWIKGRMQPLPSGPLSLLTSPLTRGLVPVLLREAIRSQPCTEDKSIYDFFAERFHPKLAERLIDPLVLGIYGGDIRQLSVESCFPQLFQWAKKDHSVVRGAWKQRRRQEETLSPWIQEKSKASLLSFNQGMAVLPQTLSYQLDDLLHCNTTVEKIALSEEGGIDVYTSQGHWHAQQVVSALPARMLGPLLQEECPDVAEGFSSLPYASIQGVSMAFGRPVLPLQGFGYLIPSQEKESVLGCVWDSSVFPSQQIPGSTVLTFMMHPGQEDPLDSAQQALREHLGIRQKPDQVHTFLAHKAIPQYPVHYHQTLQGWETKLKASFPSLTLLGNSYYGVSVNDCIHHAQSKAEAFSLSQQTAEPLHIS